MSDRQEQKAALRRKARAAREKTDAARRQALSEQICNHLIGAPLFQRAHSLHSYVALPEEVDTLPLIRAALAQGKTVIVPRVSDDHAALEHYAIPGLDGLQPGTFGIPEPDPHRCRQVEPGLAEIVVVPGVAFDRRGNRIGYGKGYYDRFLQTLPALKVGFAFALQLVPDIPAEPTDVRMDWLVTESGILFAAGDPNGTYRSTVSCHASSLQPNSPKSTTP